MKRIKRFVGELIIVRNGEILRNVVSYATDMNELTWDMMEVAKNLFVAYLDPGKKRGPKINYSVWGVITKEGVFTFEEKLLVKGAYLVLSAEHTFIHVKKVE